MIANHVAPVPQTPNFYPRSRPVGLCRVLLGGTDMKHAISMGTAERCLHSGGSYGRVAKRIVALLSFGLMFVSLAVLPAHAQAPLEGRPILFVHGWCGSSGDWSGIAPTLINYVMGQQPQLYTDSTLWTMYYDGQSVKLWPSGNDIGNVPKSARFFAIDFADLTSLQDPFNFSNTNVAAVSVLNKADELAHVIQAITALTHIKDVVIIGHSMG